MGFPVRVDGCGRFVAGGAQFLGGGKGSLVCGSWWRQTAKGARGAVRSIMGQEGVADVNG